MAVWIFYQSGLSQEPWLHTVVACVSLKKDQQTGFSHTKQEFAPKATIGWNLRTTESGFSLYDAAGEKRRQPLVSKYVVT